MSVPSPPQGVLSAADVSPSRRVSVPQFSPEGTPSRGLWIAALGVVGLVGGTFVWAARDTAPESTPTQRKVATVRSAAPKRIQVAPAPKTSQARSESPRAVDPRGRAKARRYGHPIRRVSKGRFWTGSRLAELKKKDIDDVWFGNEPAKPRDFKRPYDNEKLDKPQPLLTIATQPPGMTVYVDGQLSGRTPFIRPVSTDTLRAHIKLTGTGYVTEEATVRADRDGHLRYNVVMTKE